MSNFAIIRLGKDSVADIKTLDALHGSPRQPVVFALRCAQVPQELAVGSYAFFCLGSDNNKGIPTAWVRGVRALGTITSKTGGPGYNDQWEVGAEIRVVLPQSVSSKDLLAHAPTAYYWCSDLPVLGVDTHSNQTVQLIKAGDLHQDVRAFAYALKTIFSSFETDAKREYPELAPLFEYSPPVATGGAPSGAGASATLAGTALLSSLVGRFSEDSRKCPLRVEGVPARRFACSLLSKRFLIATGLAGSGKTKMAQAFARWLTPRALPPDPFSVGSVLKGAQSEYTVIATDAGIVQLRSEDGKVVPLPRVVIEEWADYIEKNGITDTMSARELRDQIEAGSNITAYLHRLESHYKPAAFALVAARKSLKPAKCYEVVSVGADWSGNENVLGYPNGLEKAEYITKPALDLILHAKDRPNDPHFLILDEMNLSHVERYFADILSVIESEEKIHLHRDKDRKANGKEIPAAVELPKNLFIIGTVNVDETTYMFSPKVLDRANVIEFRMEAGEMEAFLGDPAKADLSKLDGAGHADFGKAFVDAAKSTAAVPLDAKATYEAEMLLFFRALQSHGVEFGYRVAHEAARFVHFYKLLGNGPDDGTWFPGTFDCVVVQKFLPKLHGSRAKLGPLLKALWFLCVTAVASRGADPLKAAQEAARSTDKKAEPSAEVPAVAPYPLSADKIARMWRLLRDNGFASFAEA